MKCEKCGGNVRAGGERTTLVWYNSPPGHDHDDNCRTRAYTCIACGHTARISRRNKCPACDWQGKEECFCHPGKKVDEWPIEGAVEDDKEG